MKISLTITALNLFLVDVSKFWMSISEYSSWSTGCHELTKDVTMWFQFVRAATRPAVLRIINKELINGSLVNFLS
ncbi:MAG: hypothetical protein ACJAZ0_001728 [Halioglobus sp.]